MALCLAIATQAPASTPDSYLINVGDELEFDILDDNEPPQRFTVGGDGELQLPFIGGLVVEEVTVGEARDLIRRTYIEREIFVNPMVELSIASFRPIFVLGDVRKPGNYDYQLFLTAEQAVGLAGGLLISANNEEARVLERRNLEGTLTGLEFDLGLLAAQYARVQAQLKEAVSLAWTDVPQDVQPAVSRELFDAHKKQEDRIIALEAEDARTRRKLLEDAVKDATTRIGLLAQREAVQSRALRDSTSELERIRDLAERGLTPKSGVNRQELQVSTQEDALLELREQRSSALIQLADLRSQLSQFDASRKQNLLSKSQSYWSDINKMISTQASLEDRLRLLQQWMNAAAGLETELLVEYQVRRRESSGVINLNLKPYDELVPGDLLVIVVKPPELLGEPG